MGHAYDTDREAARRAADRALERWIARGLAYRLEAGRPYFDIVEVTNFMRRAVREDEFFSNAYVATLRRLVVEARGVMGTGERPRRFDVDFTRTFAPRTDARATIRLRAPLPRVDRSLYDLTVVPRASHDPSVRITYADGRLEARGSVPPGRHIELGARLSFTARLRCADDRRDARLTDADRATYLREREGLVVVSARVAARAVAVAAGGETPVDVAYRLWNDVCATVTIGALHYDQIDPAAPCDRALDGGWADCRLAASLYVALCRACGVPARVVGGYLLYAVVSMAHYWAEVWIEGRGWMPVDFLGWDAGDAGRDRDWRDRFFGTVDHGMVTERLPLEFTGAPGVPMPSAWSLLQTANARGTDIALLDEGGRSVYADTLRVASSPSLED